jgi:cytochrome c oxidase subunit 2
MKIRITRRLIGTWIFAAAGAISLAIPMMGLSGTTLVQQARASEEPRVIEIKAKKFEFSPAEITLKKGEPVILRLTTEDRTHGFLLKPLKIDTDIIPDKVTDVPLTPEVAGNYTIICDHYCGTGHGNMKLKMSVVE